MTSTTATETGNSTGTQEQPKSPNKATDTTATIAANDKPINDNNKDDKGSDRKDDQAKANDGANDGAAAATGDQQGTSSPTKTLEPKPTVHKIDYEKDIVYLYQFPRCPTLPSASPFCLKVESWLRMAGIKYENVDHKMKYKSKKGQLPFIEMNGKEIADSEIIIKELSTYFEKDLDEGLTTDQRNNSHAFESMLNNHTSWVVRWWRYNNPGEFIKSAQLDIKRTLNSRLPKGLLNFFFKLGFKSNVKQAVGHGLGRHTADEIFDFGKSDLKTLGDLLGDKEYFFGKEPHLLDCVAFAHLCQFVYVPFGGMNEWMEKETPNLLKFVERMKERYWPDWDEACKTLELNTHLPKKEETAEDEKKKEEEKKKEDKKKEKEEKKKEEKEKKKKEKEERERKKKEEKEKAEKEAAEKKAQQEAEKKANEPEKKDETSEKKEEKSTVEEKAEKEEDTKERPEAKDEAKQATGQE